MPRPKRRRGGVHPLPHRHAGHNKARCLKIFRRLSLYLDGELPDNVCKEIRKHLHGCDHCEVFLASFKRTVNLCRRYPAKPMSPAAKDAIRAAVLKSA